MVGLLGKPFALGFHQPWGGPEGEWVSGPVMAEGAVWASRCHRMS